MRSMAHKHVRDGLRYPSMPVDVSVILHSGTKECADDELAGP
jgi:hypothetical protein